MYYLFSNKLITLVNKIFVTFCVLIIVTCCHCKTAFNFVLSPSFSTRPIPHNDLPVPTPPGYMKTEDLPFCVPKGNSNFTWTTTGLNKILLFSLRITEITDLTWRYFYLINDDLFLGLGIIFCITLLSNHFYYSS